MRPDVDNVLFYLPNIRRLVRNIYLDLEQGRSVAIIAPQKAQIETLWNLVLDNRDFVPGVYLDIVEIEIVDSELTPGCFLSKALNLDLPPIEGDNFTYEIMKSDGTPGVIALRGLEQFTSSRVDDWCAFLAKWTVISGILSSERYRPPPALFAPLVALPQQIPEEDAWLRIHRWWSVLSDLDVRVLCRTIEGLGYPELPHETAWREAVLPALAGNDLDLIRHLWDVVKRPKNEIFDSLRDLSEAQGWTQQNLTKLGLRDFLQQYATRVRSFFQEPTAKEAELWVRGLIYQTPENGIQVSALALAALDEWDLLEHLLWRGQAALLLPILDELRLSICKELTDRYGPDWPLQWARPLSIDAEKAVRNNPYATEWGHLKEAVIRCPHPSERRRFELVTQAWVLRNQLAHYRSIEYEDFQTLMRLMG